MTPHTTSASPGTVAWALAIDCALITVFAALGIASHNGDLGVLSIARVAVPFLLPYLVLVLLFKPGRYIHNIFSVGVALWLATVILGPILRAVFFGDTSALPFILVTTGVLGLFLLGRRSISTLVTRKRQRA